ncbi:lysine biosynthesis protein LysX [Stetteria hydrogenophila]
MEVALLYDVVRLEEKMLIKELRERASLRLIHTPTATLEIGRPPGGEVDAALVRCISYYTAVAAAAAAESWGAVTVNSSTGIAVSGDKVVTQSLLHRAGIPTPRSILAFSVDSAVKAAESLGYPVVFKPTVGSWGRLAALASDEEAVRAVAEHREYLGGPYRVHYLQEYVRKPGRDIRAMCVGGAVPAAIYRVSQSWITNMARGARAEPARVDGEMEDLVARACETVGVDTAGVDLVEDPERGYLVLEVNGVPEFKNVATVTGVNVAGMIAEHLLEKARR